MKKINTILAAFGALLMLSVTSANSIELKAGVSLNGMAAYANAKETLKDSGAVTNAEAIIATNYVSSYLEVSSEQMMGMGIGVSYAPDVVDLNSESRTLTACIDNTITEAAGCTASTEADSGTTNVSAKIEDLISVYVTLPVGDTGAYVKAGYIQAVMITEESLATGSAYNDVDLTGTELAGGIERPLGDMAFWRAEGSYQMWDDIESSGSETGADGVSKNQIRAELGSVTGSLSVGMKF
jgi:hypothetical protein